MAWTQVINTTAGSGGYGDGEWGDSPWGEGSTGQTWTKTTEPTSTWTKEP